MRLFNKVVLITASTRGIGLGCVKECAKEGAVVYMAARNLELAKNISEDLCNQGYNVKYVYNDASKPETFISMIKEVIEKEGHLDVLVNNFGTSNPKKDLDLVNTNVDDYLDIININIRSVFLASQEVAKHMANSGGGSIINISSIGGIIPDISQIAYGTSKSAINYLTKLIAVQEAHNNIRCNAVLPGMIQTEALDKHLSDDFKNFFLKHVPLKKIGITKEIASAVVYFASDDSAYTTGQILAVSGGFGLATPVYGDLSNNKIKR